MPQVGSTSLTAKRRLYLLFMGMLGMMLIFLVLTVPTGATTDSAERGGEVWQFCSDPNAPIPDGDSVGVESTMTITQSGIIQKVDVILHVAHPTVGNLKGVLSNGSTQVTILERPNGGLGDCEGDNLRGNIASDDATLGFNEACNNQNDGAPAYDNSAAYRAGNPPGPVLAAFDGRTTAGTWRLNFRDLEAGGIGTLDTWCLQFTVIAATVTPTPSPTRTATRTATITPTRTHTPGPSPTPSRTPTSGPAPTRTPPALPTATPQTPLTNVLYAPLAVLNTIRNCQSIENELTNPNNTAEQAEASLPLCVGETLRGRYDLAQDREDIYRFEVTSGDNDELVLLQMILDVPDINLNLYLYDENLTEIGRSVAAGTQDENIITGVVSGTYFVRVYRTDTNTSLSDYFLTVTTTSVQ